MKKIFFVFGLIAGGMLLERVFQVSEVFIIFSTFLVIFIGLREIF